MRKRLLGLIMVLAFAAAIVGCKKDDAGGSGGETTTPTATQ